MGIFLHKLKAVRKKMEKVVYKLENRDKNKVKIEIHTAKTVQIEMGKVVQMLEKVETETRKLSIE